MSYLVFRLSGHPKDSNGATVGMDHSSKQSVCGVQCVVLLYRCTQHLRNSNQYSDKNVAEPNEITEGYSIVPHYPRPVAFHWSRVSHVTTEKGIKCILFLVPD